MRKISTNDVATGMIVAEPIYTLDHKQILVPQGIKLTEAIIDRISSWQIPFVMVEEAKKEMPPEDLNPDLPDLSVLPVIMAQKTRNFVSHLEGAVAVLHTIFEGLHSHEPFDFKLLTELAAKVENHLTQPAETINNMLFRMPSRVEPDYLAHHSVAVAAVSGMIVKWMELPAAAVTDVFLAGLLHDIGYTQMPRSLMADDNPTPERQELMKQHVVHGLKLLKGIAGIKQDILAVVAQHHEALDGSGYPMGISGDKMRPYAKIAAFADMLCRTLEKNPRTNPFILVEDIKAQMFSQLDPVVCDTFIRRFNDYLMNNSVKLNDGRRAKVVFVPSVNPTAPILKTDDDEIIDLTRKIDIKIEKVLF